MWISDSSLSQVLLKNILITRENKDNGSNGKYDVVMCFRLVASSFVYCLFKVSESPTYLYLSITSRPSYVVICFFLASLPVCEMSKSHESVSVHLYLLFQCGNIFFYVYFLLFTVCGKSKSSVPVYLFLSLNVVICFFCLLPSPVYCLLKVDFLRIYIWLSLPVPLMW